MKKVVKSRSQLNAKALSNGATITNKSGSKFNAGGSKTNIVKKIGPKKKQERSDNASMITEAVEKQTFELKTILESLVLQMVEIKSNSHGPITEWDFKVIRKNDRISDIQARVPVRVLN